MGLQPSGGGIRKPHVADEGNRPIRERHLDPVDGGVHVQVPGRRNGPEV